MEVTGFQQVAVEPGERPAARCSHTVTRVGSLLWLIGGGALVDGEMCHLADLWQLCTVHWRWTRVRTAGDQFVARRGHTAVLEGDGLVVHGGTTGGFSSEEFTLNDTMVLQLDPPVWRHRSCSGQPPPRRRGHSAGLAGRQMLVWGGTEPEPEGQISCLDLDSWSWGRLALADCLHSASWWPQGACTAFSACTVHEGLAFSFGGQYVRAETLEEMFPRKLTALRLAGTRLELVAEAAGEAGPCGRFCHGMAASLGGLVLVGGSTVCMHSGLTEFLNDTWVFCLQSGRWVRAEPGGWEARNGAGPARGPAHSVGWRDDAHGVAASAGGDQAGGQGCDVRRRQAAAGCARLVVAADSGGPQVCYYDDCWVATVTRPVDVEMRARMVAMLVSMATCAMLPLEVCNDVFDLLCILEIES